MFELSSVRPRGRLGVIIEPRKAFGDVLPFDLRVGRYTREHARNGAIFTVTPAVREFLRDAERRGRLHEQLNLGVLWFALNRRERIISVSEMHPFADVLVGRGPKWLAGLRRKGVASAAEDAILSSFVSRFPGYSYFKGTKFTDAGLAHASAQGFSVGERVPIEEAARRIHDFQRRKRLRSR